MPHFNLFTTFCLMAISGVFTMINAVRTVIAAGFSAVVGVILSTMNSRKRLAILYLTAFFSTAQAEWQVTRHVDELSDKVSVTALSAHTSPVQNVGGLYNNIESTIVFSCNNGREFVGLITVPVPILAGGDITNYGREYEFRVRWDDDTPLVTKIWRPKDDGYLIFRNEIPTIQRIRQHNSVRIEFRLYRHGNVVFKFDLIGATKAIDEAREICANANSSGTK